MEIEGVGVVESEGRDSAGGVEVSEEGEEEEFWSEDEDVDGEESSGAESFLRRAEDSASSFCSSSCTRDWILSSSCLARVESDFYLPLACCSQFQTQLTSSSSHYCLQACSKYCGDRATSRSTNTPHRP